MSIYVRIYSYKKIERQKYNDPAGEKILPNRYLKTAIACSEDLPRES